MKEENTNSGCFIPKNNSRSLITSFLSNSNKLCVFEETKPNHRITILQNYDKKTIFFAINDIEKTLERVDEKGEEFLQVNFKNGKKIILTEEFIGFAPAGCVGLPLQKLPKVVTTADLLSVIEAIESSVYDSDQYQESLYDVKLFFESIAGGAESIGFDLTGERLWVEKLVQNKPLN